MKKLMCMIFGHKWDKKLEDWSGHRKCLRCKYEPYPEWDMYEFHILEELRDDFRRGLGKSREKGGKL